MGNLALASLIAAIGCLASGCAPTSEVPGESETTGELSDETLALAALRALGAKVDGAATQRCQGACHDVNQATLNAWAIGYRQTMSRLQSLDKPVGERVNVFKREASNPSSSYAPHGLGFIAAAVKLSSVPTAIEPKTLALLASLDTFFGDADERAAFANSVSMPLDPSMPRLSAVEMEAVLAWVDRGMPQMGVYIAAPVDQPTKCVEDLSRLPGRVRDGAATTWGAYYRDNHLPMFACEPGANSIDCFQQQLNGGDVFPTKGKWAADGSTLRVLDALDKQTYFWMRTSADGRYVANGLSLRGMDGGNISDLAAKLTGGSREIFVAATEDPDFAPDNRGFMFQSPAGAAYCPQSVLDDASVTHIDPFAAGSGCTDLGRIGLYETIAQPVGDDAYADRFISSGNFVNDNGTQEPFTMGPGARLTVRVMRSRGTDAHTSYDISQITQLPIPYEGDAILSRSGGLVASRVAGRFGQLGYTVRQLTATPTSDGYDLAADVVGRICAVGSKATFSFDERFLTMHRYMYVDGDGKAQYSDIWIIDLVTGEKRRVTKMSTGTYALYPHFRADGWLYFLVRGAGAKDYIVASDAALRMAAATP